MSVSPVPAGYHTVTPYLVVPGVAGVVRFLIEAFGAELASPMATRPDGTVMHADVKLGDSHVMLGEPTPGFDAMPAMVHLYVPNVDERYAAALRAGAVSVSEPTNHFYGDRSGGVRDASGNVWWISTRVEDVSPEEIARRAAAERPAPGD
ncbi:MAG: VOC family protein [Isosphaeraceae bacterium]